MSTPCAISRRIRCRQVKAGNIKAYAVTAKKRWFAAPDVPTVAEAGVPGVEVINWLGAYAPKGTPEVVAKLNAAFRAAMADPAVAKRIADQGLEIPPPEQQSPEAFAAYLKSEMDKWGAVILRVGPQGTVTTMKKTQSLALAALCAASIAASPVRAQNFPSKPVTMIVPFPAGGGSDDSPRIVAERMRVSLGQPVIVENVGGAGGTIGTTRVARATPDGYTIGFGQWTSHVGAGASIRSPSICSRT